MVFGKTGVVFMPGFLWLMSILGCSGGGNDRDSFCGNGLREGCERCDGADLGVSTCAALGYAGGTLACLPTCLFDESECQAPPACEDKNLDPGEVCDGENLGAVTCQALGFDGGNLSCVRGCTFDKSKCYKCGNGVREASEKCDGADLGGASCQALGHAGGALVCLQSCLFDESDCLQPLRFITVGDPHIGASDGMPEKRLGRVVELVNQSNVDFVVLVGDVTTDGIPAQFESLKEIIKPCNKLVKYVIGNHDFANGGIEFETYLGVKAARIEEIKGYQKLFIGIGKDGGSKWVFDFDSATKDAPTLVFMHGSRYLTAVWENTDSVQYPKNNPSDIKKYLDDFPKLLGVFSGHTHQLSYFDIDGVKWIDNGSLRTGGQSGIAFWNHTTHVGYTKIENGAARFTPIPYEDSLGNQVDFSDPFP